MKVSALRSVLGLAALLAVGCDSGPTDVTRPIGATGGTVSSGDGTSVVIPPGALATTASITITPISAAAPAGTVLVGPAYDFAPDGTTFAQPVTITLPFDMTKIPSGRTTSDIRIYTAARGSTQYTALQTTLSGKTVQTSTTHFTVYLPAVPAVTSGGSDMGTSSPCIPTCGEVSGGCTCTASCNGHTYQYICTHELATDPLNCYCETDGATQSSPIPSPPSTCSGASTNTGVEILAGQCVPSNN